MNNIKRILLSFVMLAAIAGLCTTATAEGINWYKYDAGMAKASSEGKKIYINFHADWCYYCKVMKKTTFKDATVAEYLNKNFISIRVDTEKEKKLAREFNIRGLPANWFLEPNGEKIGLKSGYLKPNQLLQNLKFIYDEKYKTQKK